MNSPQQAVSDTAMDIQEAENGTETSKFTQNIGKTKVTSSSWSCMNFFAGHPETPAASAPAPPAAEVI